MWAIKQILVPVDFSNTSRAAISAALQIASDQDACVTLLHVEAGMDKEIKRRIYAAPNDSTIDDTIAYNEQALRDAANLEIQRARESGNPLPFVSVTPRIVGGDWLEVMLRLTDELDVDLIVTGTHGRGSGVKGLFASYSEKIVAKVTCSVLVVKPQGFPYLID
jgi:universal stress protein A